MRIGYKKNILNISHIAYSSLMIALLLKYHIDNDTF